MATNLPTISQTQPTRISSGKQRRAPSGGLTSRSVPCVTQVVHLPGVSVLRNPILGETYNVTRSNYPWINNRRARASNSIQSDHERSIFTNRQHMMKNIYDISPDWVSDRSPFFNPVSLPRSPDYSWKHTWDHVPRPRYMQAVSRQNSRRSSDIIGINDVRRAIFKVPLPTVSARTNGYKLPAVTNPMGPCASKYA